MSVLEIRPEELAPPSAEYLERRKRMAFAKPSFVDRARVMQLVVEPKVVEPEPAPPTVPEPVAPPQIEIPRTLGIPRPLFILGHPPVPFIIAVCCKYFDVKAVDLLSERRNKEIILPRHIAIFLTKTLTFRSLPDIGRRFGRRDHTTILSAVRKIESAIATDANVAATVEELRLLIMGDNKNGEFGSETKNVGEASL